MDIRRVQGFKIEKKEHAFLEKFGPENTIFFKFDFANIHLLRTSLITKAFFL